MSEQLTLADYHAHLAALPPDTYRGYQYREDWKMTPAEEALDALAQFREKYREPGPYLLLGNDEDAAAARGDTRLANVSVGGRPYIERHVWYVGVVGGKR